MVPMKLVSVVLMAVGLSLACGCRGVPPKAGAAPGGGSIIPTPDLRRPLDAPLEGPTFPGHPTSSLGPQPEQGGPELFVAARMEQSAQATPVSPDPESVPRLAVPVISSPTAEYPDGLEVAAPVAGPGRNPEPRLFPLGNSTALQSAR